MSKLHHRMERITNALAERMETTIDSLATGMKGGSDIPPFSVKLSRREQLEQYFSMDESKWEALITERGLHEAMRYSKAMNSLVKSELGTSGQPSAPMLLGPEPLPPEYDAVSQQPLQNVNPAVVMEGMAKQAGQEERQAQQPQPAQTSDQVVQSALQSAGLDPSQFGGG